MNEWLKKVIAQIKTQWGKWSIVQKIILFSIIGVAIVSIVLLFTVSAQPSSVPLITAPITNQENLTKISMRLDEEGVEHRVSEEGMIYVPDARTRRYLVPILIRENLIPQQTSPFAIFNTDPWTITDFEREVQLQQAVTENLIQYIEALEDVDDARVILGMPEQQLFAENQDPVTASVSITPRPGSDIISNRYKIEGIQRMVLMAIPGLMEENIVITDHTGQVLNDFASLADFDRLKYTERELKLKLDLERKYQGTIKEVLSSIFTPQRIAVTKVDIILDTDPKKTNVEEYFPITLQADNPNTPFSETEVIPNVLRSTERRSTDFEGTGYNPEGPPGSEGQIPPAYKELDGAVGRYGQDSAIENYEINKRTVEEEKIGADIGPISVGVALDGQWVKERNEDGSLKFDPKDGSIVRTYLPPSTEELENARTLVQNAIGYNALRGDQVNVVHIQRDRTAEFESEDEQYRNQQRIYRTIVYSLIVLGVIVIAFIVFRLISRELERRRRLREEELSRQHQAMREAALRSAEEEGIDVQMSVEERARLEMQENAINMAREHPEDVAQLIRTWLIEE